MRIGVPRETKQGEARVALGPAEAGNLARDVHEVVVETQAGARIGHDDAAYRDHGARIGDTASTWACDLIVKVKEIQDADLPHLREGQAIFGFQQLPREPQRTRALAGRGITAIAYEMVRDARGFFPLLAPMSVLAGKLAIPAGIQCLGRKPERVLVLGAGKAGIAAAATAMDAGSRVVVLTRSQRSRDLAREALGPAAETALASREAIERHALDADLVVGAVLVVGEPTPKLLPRSLVARMKRGAAIVDVCIDGGGVAETSRATTHAQPTYVEEGVVHYCVPNMPAAVPAEASAALAAAVLPFVRELAAKGVERAVRENEALRNAVLIWKGRVAHPGIAAEAGLEYAPVAQAVPP